jgi:hypothetical protein
MARPSPSPSLEILIAAGFPHWSLSWAADASTARSGDEWATIVQVLPESDALPPGEGRAPQVIDGDSVHP